MKRKISLFMILVTALCISMVHPLRAQEQWQLSLDTNSIKVGYTQVYSDNKPTVPSTTVNITIDSQEGIGKEYLVYLKNVEGKKVPGIEIANTITKNQELATLTLPGDLKHGMYEVVLMVDNVEKDIEEINILNNLNIGSTISTDVVGYTGNTWDLVDGLQWAMYTPKNNKPTRDNPAHFIFDYGNEVVDVESVDIFSTYGNDQGPRTIEIEYWDLQSNTWVTILNQGNKEYELIWKDNVESEPVHIQFDKQYSTTKIRFKVVDSNTSWENTNDIVELQVWGYKSSVIPAISLSSDAGVFNQSNTTLVTLRNNKVTEKVKLELVDFDTKLPVSPPINYEIDMIDGKLSYDFIMPDNLGIGTYAIHAIGNTLDIYSNAYKISLNQEKYFNNYSTNFRASLIGLDTTDIDNIIDDDITTSWNIKDQDTFNILFETKAKNNAYTNLILKSMKVYANKESIDKVTLKGVANTNYYRNVNVSENGMINDLTSSQLDWQKDQNGDYFILSPGYLSFGNLFILEVKTKDSKSVTIQEIETQAMIITDNILNEATIYHNDKKVDASQMFNNNVSSFYKTNKGTNDAYVFDFSPRTVTTDQLLYTAHFPKSQGVSKTTLEYWDGSAWHKLDTYDFNYKTDGQIREVKQMVFTEVETTKLRMTVNEANTVWDSSYLFTNLNMIGKINVNAQYIADNLDSNIVVNQGDTKLPLPLVDDKYTVSINASDNESVVDLSGNIHPSNQEMKVNISLKVSGRTKNDVGITKPITVSIPKAVKDDNTVINPIIDTSTIYNNPAMGWVQYYEFQDTDVDIYWQEMDKLYQDGLKTNILYIRNPWSWYEPQEGKYAWLDTNSNLSKLIVGARQRGIQLAFRVLLDSSDAFQQATPEYVFDAGATWYPTDRTDPTAPVINSKDPYINDPIFLEKLDSFLEAFGNDFNEDLDIAFIDGMGFGNWGEVHHMKYNTTWDNNVNDAIEKVIALYDKHFPDVLLGAQEGQPENYGTEQNDDLITNNDVYTGAFDKKYDFVVRRDTFGWMTDSIRQQVNDWFDKGIPIFAENCYHSFQVREHWYNNAGYPTLDGILRQVVADALECRANTLDARIVMDCQSWLQNDKDNGSGLLDLFGREGGYRFAPTSLEVPKILEVGKETNIHHAWRNFGVGMLPNKNKHWDNKYHVAFALLDSKTNDVVYQYNESINIVNPGDWILENGNYNYDTKFTLPSYLDSGEYKLAVGIVNNKNNNQPEIQLALQGSEIVKDGWHVVDTIQVNNPQSQKTIHKIIIDPVDNGQIITSAIEIETGNNVDLQFIPNDGYILNNAYINGNKINVKDNYYRIENITEDQHIQAIFNKEGNSEVGNNNNTNTGDTTKITGLWLLLIISIMIGVVVNKKRVLSKDK